MNASGYQDPTAEQAVSRAERFRRYCKKHDVVVGQEYKLTLYRGDPIETKPKKKVLKVKVIDVYEKFVVIQYKSGYKESMFWKEFHEARGDK